MKSRASYFVVLCSAVTGLTMSAFAAFEPLFQVAEITGECNLQRPSEKAMKPAEQAKAYPFGTRIATGQKSNLVITFSKGNTCRILPNSSVVVAESATDKKVKIVKLIDGEVEIKLKEDFHKGGYGLNVETPAAVFAAIGCDFRVASKKEQGLRIVVGRIIEGTVSVAGENFLASTLDKDDWISILSPADMAFLRIKTMKGAFDVTIKDKDNQEKNIPTETGTVIKIWQRAVPETHQNIVTTVVTAPDGQLVETHTVTYEQGQSSGFANFDEGTAGSSSVDVEENQKGDKGKAKQKGEEEPKASERGNPVVEHHLDEAYMVVDPGASIDMDPDPAKDTCHSPTPVGKR